MPKSDVPASSTLSGLCSARRRSFSRRSSTSRFRSRANCGTITYLLMSRTYSRGGTSTGTRGSTCPRPWETRVVVRSSTGVSNSSERANASAMKS